MRTGNAIFSGSGTRFHTPYLMEFLDVTLNLSNCFKVNPQRNVEFILFGGVGDVNTFKNKSQGLPNNNCFTVRYGLACDFYIFNGDGVFLFIEPCFTQNNYFQSNKFCPDYILI